MPTLNQGATRFYSDRQESAVADYLEWKRTPASGARPFAKGDIVSDEFVGECKTHTSRCQEVSFYFSDWTKLNNEAMGFAKKPVLFSDNGTQQIAKTFCLIDRKFSDGIRIKESTDNPGICAISRTKIRFSVSDMENLILDEYGFHFVYGDKDLVIMHIRAFKRLIDGDFYD